MTKARDISFYGLGVGIQSAGSVISGTGVTTLNFIGAANTFTVVDDRVDISIAGGIGIQSAGSVISESGVTQLNFIGAANTFAVVDDRVDISIAGGIGIQSAGSVISESGVTQLNFIGAGNTFAVNGNTVDVSIAGGGGGAGGIGIQSGGSRVAYGITDVNIAIGSTTSRNITAIGDTSTISVDLGEYYIFRKPSVGFATMRVLIAGSNGGIAKSDYLGGSEHVGMTTVNTDQFPWVAGIGITISSLGHLIFTVP